MSDVYYEQSKMKKWKDICVRQFESQKQKIEKLISQVKSI